MLCDEPFEESDLDLDYLPKGEQYANYMKNTQPPPTGIEELRARYHEVKSAWLLSDCRQLVLRRIDAHRPAQGWCVSKAICFALGSSQRRHGDPGFEWLETFTPQLVLFLDIAGHCKKHILDNKEQCN